MMSVVITILLAYILGIGCALDLSYVIEQYHNVKFTKKERIKLSLGSWYTCIVLNSTLLK